MEFQVSVTVTANAVFSDQVDVTNASGEPSVRKI